VKYCRLCRAVYPDSYKYCPNHGLRFVAPEWTGAQECPSCGNLGEQRDGFCGHCGADLKEQGSPESLEKRAAELDKGVKTVSETTQPNAEETRAPFEPHDSSVFKKKISDKLTDAFASLNPHERPWFGMDLDGDLLAVTPYGITVTEVIDPGTVETGTIHPPVFFGGPWLLCLPDGTDRAIENPIERVNRAIRRVEDKLRRFFRARNNPLQNRITGLVVFPDRYRLSLVNDHRTPMAQSVTVRVVNARELMREMLRVVHAEPLDSDLCRKWLSTTVLHNLEDDSVALTWLDPSGETISERVYSHTSQKSMIDEWKLPVSELPKGFTKVNGHRPRQKIKAVAKIAGSALVIGLGLLVVWQVYEPNKRISESSVARRLLGADISRSEVPSDKASLAPNDPKPWEAPDEKDSSKLTDSSGSTNGNHLANSIQGPDEIANPLPAADPPPVNPSPPTGSSQRAIENQIGRAIHQRAVEGVVVSVVNDTAYLTGAVLSEKQKAAAEEAARNVPGVKRVHSSISVKWASG
jgi:hypothetical protein